MENTQVEFIERIKDVENKSVGHETYGNVTEFYDEDGVVLMVSTIKEDDEETGLQATEFSFKSDKYTEEEVNEEEASSFTKEIGSKFFLVSAQNGNGINNMFQTLAETYLDPTFRKKIDDNANEYQRKNSITLVSKNFTENKNTKNTKCC